MRPLLELDAATLAGVKFVLTDMDDTLTYEGSLSSRTYNALERLTGVGIRVVIVTAACAGWCDQMARMWPIDGVIGENGGFFFRRVDQSLWRLFWHGAEERAQIARRLARTGDEIAERIAEAKLSDDQPFRLTSLAFSKPSKSQECDKICAAMQNAQLDMTINNLWVLGWLGGYDKLSMARRVLAEAYGVDVAANRHSIAYVGDSMNDAPMFAFFQHTFGVSTVARYLSRLPLPPSWITEGPGGDGFVEVADVVLASRR